MLSTKAVDYAILAFCAAVAGYVKEQSGATGPASIILPAIYALMVYLLLQVTIYFAERLWVVRYFLKPEAKYEGDWLELSKVDNVPLYGMFSVYFDTKSMKYQVCGVAIRGDGSEYASWNSTSFQLQSSQTAITYTYDGHIVGNPHTVEGYCFLGFIRRLGSVRDGRGYFIDLDKPLRIDFEIDKVDTATIRQHFPSKTWLATKQDQIDFIRSYHKLKHPTEPILLDNQVGRVRLRPAGQDIASAVDPAGGHGGGTAAKTEGNSAGEVVLGTVTPTSANGQGVGDGHPSTTGDSNQG